MRGDELSERLSSEWLLLSAPLPAGLRVPRVLRQILVDGVKSEHIYRVIQGIVRVEKVDRRAGSERNLPAAGAIVNKLEAGHTFGEMSFLDDEEVPCATCLADSADVQVRRCVLPSWSCPVR